MLGGLKLQMQFMSVISKKRVLFAVKYNLFLNYLYYFFFRVLHEASHEYSELRTWLSQETSWLDGLQRKLCKSPNAPADAEEISDELYVRNLYLLIVS